MSTVFSGVRQGWINYSGVGCPVEFSAVPTNGDLEQVEFQYDPSLPAWPAAITQVRLENGMKAVKIFSRDPSQNLIHEHEVPQPPTEAGSPRGSSLGRADSIRYGDTDVEGSDPGADDDVPGSQAPSPSAWVHPEAEGDDALPAPSEGFTPAEMQQGSYSPLPHGGYRGKPDDPDSEVPSGPVPHMTETSHAGHGSETGANSGAFEHDQATRE